MYQEAIVTFNDILGFGDFVKNPISMPFKKCFMPLKTHFENDMLIAQLQFLNMDTDELIFWTDNNVSCSYTIYRTESFASSEKYEEIISGEKVLSRDFQNIYIDIVDQLEVGTWYLIESTVDTGYRTLKASNTFAL